MSKDINDKNYEIGYQKPPKHSQFKPGQSGNPNGRPKGCNNLKTDVLEVLRMTINVMDNGNSKKINAQKAALLKLIEGALKGDTRKLDKLLKLSEMYNNEEVEQPMRNPSKDDKAILEAYYNRSKHSETEKKIHSNEEVGQ